MEVKDLQLLFGKYREPSLSHRYITNEKIKPLLLKIENFAEVKMVGKSVLGDAIHSITIGNGPKRILMWSQMHGNESTTTKAIFDFLNTCISEEAITDHILRYCTLCIIPILNPDGAKAYTRVNANGVDLNRDAQWRSQPESKVLREVFEAFGPHYCYNLHGQRTIFSAGSANKSAVVSFLAPAQDPDCTITPTRKVAMEIIAEMNTVLQQLIPNQVGTYDDAFNINCVGDTFQSENIPTVLFEAGHYPNDYPREKTRELIYISYLTSLAYISKSGVSGSKYEPYFDIPENEKLFFDVIVRQAKTSDVDNQKTDIGIQFEERLEEEVVKFIPIVKKIEDLSGFYGHKEFDANGAMVLGQNDAPLKIGSESVTLRLNNIETIMFSNKMHGV